MYHKLAHTVIKTEALALMVKLENAGYKAYIVGGAVRDMIIGKKEVDDYDIATNCPIEKIEEMFHTHNIGQSRDFGILAVKSGRSYFEVAQFRKDGEYENCRHPKDVEIVDDLETDIKRRDFTVNALALDKEGILIDYVGGVDDIKNEIIRAVGDPMERFQEDYLRMMRAARFAAMEGFRIEFRTREAITKLSKSIRDVTPNRIRMELIKAAEKDGKMFARFLIILDNLKLLERILPEVSNLKRIHHDPKHHPEGRTVFEHVIKCIAISNGDYLSQLAILFHDIGKTPTMVIDEGKGPSYYYHAKVGAKMVEAVCDRLKFSCFQTEALVYAARNHMKWHRILEMKPAKIAKLINSPYFGILVDVCKADEFSRGEKFIHKGQFDKQLARVLDIKAKWESHLTDNHKLKIVNGEMIMNLTGLQPGKQVGEIKRKAEEHIINNDIDPEDIDKVAKIIMSIYEEVNNE